MSEQPEALRMALILRDSAETINGVAFELEHMHALCEVKPCDRDCQHGQLARACDRCADAAEIEQLRAELAASRERESRLRDALDKIALWRAPGQTS